MSRKLVRLFTGSGTVVDFRIRAALLFDEIKERYGVAVAADIFQATPPTPREINKLKREQLLDRYHSMRPQSVERLARQLAEENKTLPPEQKHAYGSTTIETLKRYIFRLLRGRREQPQTRFSRLLEDTEKEFADDEPGN